jgi:hypothetical protein
LITTVSQQCTLDFPLRQLARPLSHLNFCWQTLQRWCKIFSQRAASGPLIRPRRTDAG